MKPFGNIRRLGRVAACAVFGLIAIAQARAAELTVTHYGVSWSRGAIDHEGLEISLKQMQLVGAVDDKPIDWSAIVSEMALPTDLRTQ